MSRKLKILQLKHNYLKLELEDVKDDFEKYTKDFDSYFDKYYKKATRLNRGNQEIAASLQRVEWKIEYQKYGYKPKAKPIVQDSVSTP